MNFRKNISLICALAAVFMSGCATTTKYDWGGYEQSLYDYYKNPGKVEKFETELAKTTARAEKEKRVPPGMYAEYGYILLKENKINEAVRYFNKEGQMWPESTKFMNTMIKTARIGQVQASNSASNQREIEQ